LGFDLFRAFLDHATIIGEVSEAEESQPGLDRAFADLLA
jgi:hypothetical protein